MTQRKAGRRRAASILLTCLIVLGIGAVVVLAQLAGRKPPQPAAQQMTMDPAIIDNLTRLPAATPLLGQAADDVVELGAAVDACPDYTEARRLQMEQHLQWLLNPAQIPPDIIIALGANSTGRLIYGMATYTAIQWRTGGRLADSCLLPIGRTLNAMLLAVGEEPFAIFAEAS